MELSVGGLRAASQLVRVLPRPVSDLAGRGLGRAALHLSGEQRTIAERNMRRVLGPDASDAAVRRAARGVFDSYARYWVETLRLPSLSSEAVDRGFTHDGMDRIADPLSRGVGPILALPHLGGWEWAGRWLVHVRGWQVAAVAEQLEPPELYDWFVDLRRQLGMSIIPLGPKAGAEVSGALSAGRIVCLLADRDLSGPRSCPPRCTSRGRAVTPSSTPRWTPPGGGSCARTWSG